MNPIKQMLSDMRCERGGFDLCMNLDPQTDEAWEDLEAVRMYIAEGADQ